MWGWVTLVDMKRARQRADEGREDVHLHDSMVLGPRKALSRFYR